MNYYLRVWQNFDVEGVKQHLLIAGDIMGDCASCREIGIKYAEAKTCPKCGTDFKYIAARQSTGSARTLAPLVKRIRDRRPDLTFIDYGDYQSATGKQSARDFFNT